ncbi:Maf family protein [Thiomicrospira sp.]|uniref:Maf family protein n=1 Tax=Thiomicrospira sp. TaxID=935 RepID=UPI002F92909A
MTLDSPQILLASSSPYRRQLLEKIGVTFSCESPDIDERPHDQESVKETVERLSLQKAQALVKHHPSKIIIASDQSASLNNKALGKPGNFEKAFEQLKAQQGKIIYFYTGLVVYNPHNQAYLSALDTTKVYFRELSDQQIRNYLLTEQPYDCAGSFKSEGLGITLFNKIENQDPNALVGLPLIKLVNLLSQVGISLPLDPNR